MSPSSSPLRFLLYPSLGEVREHVRMDLFGRALSARLGRPVLLEWAPTYEALETEMAAGRVDLAWATSEQCNAFGPRCRAVLRVVRSGSWRYHSALVCRASEPLTLQTLQGKRVAWVAPRSTGGHLLPVRFLEEQGLRPDELFSEQRFLGTYRKAFQAVLAGEADVAASYSNLPDEHAMRVTLTHYVGASDEPRLLPFAFTHSTPADGILLTSRLSEQDCALLVSLLTSLGTSSSGLELLVGPFRTEGFHLEHGPEPSRPSSQPRSRGGEYVVAELDGQERCHRLWSPSGRAFGRDVTEAEGQPLAEVFGAEAGLPLGTLARTVRASGVGGRLEYCVEVEGRTRWYAAELSPCATRSGEAPSRWSLLVRDVSGMRHLEEPIFRMASFPLLHPEPLLELSMEGELRYANPVTYQAFPELLREGHRHPVVQAARQWAWRGGAASEPVPTVHLAGHSWELTVAQLWDPPGLRVFARDVTLRKQMEARLIQADRLSALGSLAAAVGHEMNNPLAFMLANLSFAREELERLSQAQRLTQESSPELNDVLEALAETAQGALRLKHIVQDLRTLSRKPPEHRALVDVRPLLENALKLLRGELHQRARLERDFHEVHAVDADEARLSQLFLNLLLNAVQSMEGGNAMGNLLRVAAYTSEEGEVVVEVQDTGKGLPPEELSRIFEPFVSQRPHGTGLGLSVSHAIVTSLGGTLRAESREGRGTLLTIVLPSASEDFLPRPARMTG